MLSALLLAAAYQSDVESLTLYRGAPLPSRPSPQTRYWDVADTTLDARMPDSNFGGTTVLSGGPGKVILIRFGDLQRAIGPNKRVVEAKLRLTTFQGESPSPRSIGLVQVPWGEGPVRTIDTADPSIGQEIQAAGWSASWKHRRAGQQPIGWQQSGAQGPSDAKPIAAAKAVISEGALTIEGITAEVQAAYERWYDNHGLALVFDEPALFSSSEAPNHRPTLELKLQAVQPKTGPDLSVTFIERTPYYERYDNRGDAYTRKEQNGHTAGLMDKPGLADTKKWPADGEQVTYTAHVKNVGNAPSQGFLAKWVVREKAGSSTEVTKALAPGEETTLTFQKPFKNEHTDHRTQPIGLRIEPIGPDATANNNYLEIQENALALGIWVENAFYDKFAEQTNLAGTLAFEDWVQEQFRIWNNVFFPYSRFSFAPDGILERTRVARITIVPNGTLKGGAHLPNDTPQMIFDGEWGFEGAMGVDGYIQSVRQQVDTALLHEMSHQIGLMDLYVMNVDPSKPDGTGGKVLLKDGATTPTRGAYDRFGGLMGGGDTRNDAMVPKAYQMPYEAVPDPFLDAMAIEATDLYSATDASGLNGLLGKRRGFYGEFLYALPNIVLVKAVDFNNQPLRGVELAFFQMRNGQIPDAAPAFTLVTDNSGNVSLPNRDTLEPAPFTTATGFTLKPNPFGRIDVVGSNGVFMVRAKANGVTEWAFLKLWQLADAASRGQKAALVRTLRFNVPTEPADTTGNLAKERFISDSRSTAPTELAGLLDGVKTKTVGFGEKAEEWVEIDLGRDRPFAEIRLWARSTDFWPKFDILVYSTGQTAAEGRVWARESDWRWTASNRRDADPADPQSFYVAYRGQAARCRYIRLVAKADSKWSQLSEIEVLPIKLPSE